MHQRAHCFASVIFSCALVVSVAIGSGTPAPAPALTVVLDSPEYNGTDPGLQYTIYAQHGTTGRVGVITNPRTHFNVYCAGCDLTGQCGVVLDLVEAQAAEHFCTYAVNGGPFAPGSCLSPLVSNNTIMDRQAVQGDGVQCFGMLKNNSWIMGAVTNDTLLEASNLLCGFGWLVQNGEEYWSKQVEIAPRTAVGINREGQLITLVAEGSEVAFTGLTNNQTATWMKQLGAVWAINLDGGGSSTSWLAANGGVQGCPTCMDQPYCCSRRVSSFICVK